MTWDRVDFDTNTIDFRVQRERSILDMSGQKSRGVPEFGLAPELALKEALEVALTPYVIEYNGRQRQDRGRCSASDVGASRKGG